MSDTTKLSQSGDPLKADVQKALLAAFGEDAMDWLEEDEDLELEIDEDLIKVIRDIAENPQIIIYPDPSGGYYLNLLLDGVEMIDDVSLVEIYDLKGTAVFKTEMKITADRMTLNFHPPLKSGTYTMRIVVGTNVLTRRMIVVSE